MQVSRADTPDLDHCATIQIAQSKLSILVDHVDTDSGLKAVETGVHTETAPMTCVIYGAFNAIDELEINGLLFLC
jgi:hypothetical protein